MEERSDDAVAADPSKIPSSRPNAELQEMAYLLLEDCRIEVVMRDGTGPPLRKWIAVDQLFQSIVEPPDGNGKESKAGLEVDDICRRCNLVMQLKQTEDSAPLNSEVLHLDWEQVQPFHGTIQDVFSLNKAVPESSCRCCCPAAAVKAKRSDAAMIAGLLVACRDQVSVVQCSVLFRDETQTSLLFTLSFPHLSQTAARRSILVQPSANPSKRTRAGVSKPLNSALQLLSSLVRSDWVQLEVLQQSLQEQELLKPQPLRKKPSFFPSKLTLGEIYDHIQASTSTISTSHGDNHDRQNPIENQASRLVSLPQEVLVAKMAPFLQAQSLAALRSTCTYLNWSLRGVVPGLKLRLYSHQVNSLSWMRRRESSLIQTESDCFRSAEPSLDGDVHRAITGGATVRLASKPFDNDSSWSIRLDPCTGHEIAPEQAFDSGALPRRVARGGLLCDDPGLGKTVTVLALILQTCGLSAGSDIKPPSRTQKASPPNHARTSGMPSTEVNKQHDDDAIFRAYWAERVVAEFRRPALLKLVNELSKRTEKGCSFPLGVIKKAIAHDDYGADFSAFETAVEVAVSQCISNDELQGNADALLAIFKELLLQFKDSQMRSARKSFSNAKSKPNSRVASLIEEEARQRLIESLIPSTGTLVVIPPVLMEHWKAQIKLHVDLRYCTDKEPLIFEYNKKDSSAMTVDKATILCQLRKTHAPMVFLDKAGTRPLPPADFLAMFQIVITTTHRFMNESKKGCFQDELERHNSDDIPAFRYLHDEYEQENAKEACELLKVQWLRMVVDEGHSMGNDKLNSTIQFAAWVNSQRRWAMTGTPTKQNAVQIAQLRGLMRYLQHDFFTSRLDGDTVWKRSIVKSWRDGDLVSFFRLRSLLGFLMKRHTKLDIAELAPPVFHKTEVSMSYLEATTYNTLVCAVQANLLLTAMKGKTSGFQDSLLHRSQAKNARLVLQNIRRVCTGWSRVIPRLSERWYRETISLAQQFDLSVDAIAEIRNFIWRAENEQLSACACCRVRVSTLLLMPCCGGQICTECMDSSTSFCFLCEDAFDVDDLQKFQPGFVLDWRLNLELKKNKILANAIPGPSAPVPPHPHIDLVERNGARNPAPEDGPIIRPPQDRRRKKKFGDGHTCEYDRFAADGRCVHCLEEHNSCCLLNERSRCEVCYRVAELCPEDESKSFHLAHRLLELYRLQPRPAPGVFGEAFPGDSPRPLKVIVFSQFRAALNFVGDRLLRRFGTACIAEYFGTHRKQELHKFTSEQTCFCLLLTKDGAEGLDLSFVTNIVFFEEVYDKSLQDQAISRAWRMGAKGYVKVETLIARNSIEEVMGDHACSKEDEDETIGSAPGGDRQRLKSLLQSLRFVTDYHHFSRPAEDSALEEDKKKKLPLLTA